MPLGDLELKFLMFLTVIGFAMYLCAVLQVVVR